MNNKNDLGGIIHTYQKYDPVHFPSPTAPPPDLVSPAFEHLLFYGNTRRLTEEELASAVRIDPSQIAASARAWKRIAEMLRERKRKILETYETDSVQDEARASTSTTRPSRSQPPEEARRPLPAGREGGAAPRPGEPLVRRRRRPRPVRPVARQPDRAARREVPGRRAGRQVRVHRPRADDRARRRWRSRRSWRRSTSCSSRSRRR